jgi:Holliday junction resolvasome RuvABC endonuclease subunit
MNQNSQRVRILGAAFSTRGFGYAVLEGDALIDFGRKRIYGDKNKGALAGLKQVLERNQPDLLVLPDAHHAKGTERVPRIKTLQRAVMTVAKQRKIKAVKIAGTELRSALLGNAAGTKQEMAELLAKQFPDELASLLPSKRKLWENEDPRMDIFDAVGLVVAVGMENKTPLN